MSQTHYDWEDEIGRKIGLEGISIIGLMVGEHLHPPMINDRRIWENGENWRLGAEKCIKRLAKKAKIKAGWKILDIGCGVGGPSRLLANEYKCNVIGTNVIGTNFSWKQLRTAKRITIEAGLEDKVTYVMSNAELLPFTSSIFDVIWTFNMFYHIVNKKRAISEFNRVLKNDGILAFDDWVITEEISDGEHALLKHDWSSADWITDRKLFAMLGDNGFKIKWIEDYSRVGRVMMKRYFSDVFENYFRPKIISLDAKWGESIADHFKNAIERTIYFYEEGKMRYLQFIAKKK